MKAVTPGSNATKNKSRDATFTEIENFVFISNIRQYVDYIHKQTRHHGSSHDTSPRYLNIEIPLLGPRFIAPNLSHTHICTDENIEPSQYYLAPINILHPIYYPTIQCPGCRKRLGATLWPQESLPCDFNDNKTLSITRWNSDGPRHLHGISEEEMAFGTQIKCSVCDELVTQQKQGGIMSQDSSHFTLTSMEMWDEIPHWHIPGLFFLGIFII